MLLSKEARDKAIEEAMYENYVAYFRKAEDTRRWKLHKDIPWDQANPQTSEELTKVVEGFFAVEFYLPDYIMRVMELVRRSHGRAWFQAVWGYEESKHSLGWEGWLIAAGKRTQKQMRDYQEMLMEVELERNFDTPSQMIIYQMIQERMTYINYRNAMQLAQAEGDPALHKTAHFIGIDEVAHHAFFLRGVQLYLKYYPERTIDDLLLVFKEFQMPAVDIIPNWSEVAENILKLGINNARVFLKDVRNPILEALGFEGKRALEEAAQAARASAPPLDWDPRAPEIVERAKPASQVLLEKYASPLTESGVAVPVVNARRSLTKAVGTTY
jgi:acyl-[acyl-carrier-protein] desaturase